MILLNNQDKVLQDLKFFLKNLSNIPALNCLPMKIQKLLTQKISYCYSQTPQQYCNIFNQPDHDVLFIVLLIGKWH